MSDTPDFQEVTAEQDPTGDTTTRKVQSLGRVDIPEDYLSHLDIDEGDKVFVICEEESVRIVEASADKVIGNGR